VFIGRIERAAKDGGFSNMSAFIRAAIERELAGRESGVDAAEDRIAAVSTGCPARSEALCQRTGLGEGIT
jgi:Arc/MetJ-type ribon-helix-helix transcriptional regulator